MQDSMGDLKEQLRGATGLRLLRLPDFMCNRQLALDLEEQLPNCLVMEISFVEVV